MTCTQTKYGSGSWWEVGFINESIVSKVRILTCGKDGFKHLAGTKVYIGKSLCGTLPSKTNAGKWYDVPCKSMLKGNKVRLETNKRIDISAIEVLSGVASYGKLKLVNSTAKQSSGTKWPAICAVHPKHSSCKKSGTDKTWTDSGKGQWW